MTCTVDCRLASQTLGPYCDFTAPATGLTAWLASIPIRPPGTTPRFWQERVTTWLNEDLILSARIWSHVTAFMSTGPSYLLYGELVSPIALARRHGGLRL